MRTARQRLVAPNAGKTVILTGEENLMTKEAIIAEARKLPIEEQNEIAEALRSAPVTDSDLSAEQRATLSQRYREFKTGPHEGAAWETVRERVEKSLRK